MSDSIYYSCPKRKTLHLLAYCSLVSFSFPQPLTATGETSKMRQTALSHFDFVGMTRAGNNARFTILMIAIKNPYHMLCS